MMELLKNGV
jgi:hypothetical protein